MSSLLAPASRYIATPNTATAPNRYRKTDIALEKPFRARGGCATICRRTIRALCVRSKPRVRACCGFQADTPHLFGFSSKNGKTAECASLEGSRHSTATLYIHKKGACQKLFLRPSTLNSVVPRQQVAGLKKGRVMLYLINHLAERHREALRNPHKQREGGVRASPTPGPGSNTAGEVYALTVYRVTCVIRSFRCRCRRSRPSIWKGQGRCHQASTWCRNDTGRYGRRHRSPAPPGHKGRRS